MRSIQLIVVALVVVGFIIRVTGSSISGQVELPEQNQQKQEQSQKQQQEQQQQDQARINVELLKSLPPGEKPTFHTVIKRITDMVEAEQRNRRSLSSSTPTNQRSPTSGSTSRSASAKASNSARQMNSPMEEMLSMMREARLTLEDLPAVAGQLLQSAHKQSHKYVPYANHPGGFQGAILKALGSGPGESGDGYFGIAGLLKKIFKTIEYMRNELESIIYEEFGVARPTKTVSYGVTSKHEQSTESETATPSASQYRSMRGNITNGDNEGSGTSTSSSSSSGNGADGSGDSKARQMSGEISAEIRQQERVAEESQRPGSQQTYETYSEKPEVVIKTKSVDMKERRLLDFLRDVNAFLSIIAAAITHLDFRQALHPLSAANFLLGPN